MKARYKKSKDISNLLLDTGELLFAERGYFGVSIRDITVAAGVRTASINYHFESKEKLFMAILDRRIEPLAEARLSKLNSIIPLPDKPIKTVRLIADAFTGPVLDFAQNGGTGWKNYCILIAKLSVQKFWGDNIVSLKYDEHAKKFIQALQETFPQCDPYKIHLCFQFLLSTILYSVTDNKRINTLSEEKYLSDDLGKLKTPLINFVTGGIIALVNDEA